MKKVINFLRETIFNRKWWDIEQILIAFLIATMVVGAIIFTVFAYNTVDTAKATEQDYAPLYEQVKIIQEDFDKIYDMKNVQVDLGDNIIVTFKSKECNLELELNRERTQITNVNEVDNRMSVILVLVGGPLFGAFLGCGLWLIVVLLIAGVLFVVDFAKNFVKRRKNKV